MANKNGQQTSPKISDAKGVGFRQALFLNLKIISTSETL